ncbi:MAG: hypothetical protein ACRCTD_05855, partial [Beijerinckiaceae bacterium]
MADYYPLIARAVAALKDARADERAPVYERARNALINHLKAIQPPVGETVLEAEEQALDEAIARVEAEILSGDVPGQDIGRDQVSLQEARTPAAPVVTPAGSAAPALPHVEQAPPVSGVRPVAPAARASQSGAGKPARSGRAILVGAVAGLAALAIGALAFMTRSDPTRMARNEPPPRAQATVPEQAQGKAGERVGDAGTAQPTPPPPQADAGTGPLPPPLPVAQRAILYEEQPETPGKPTQITGRAVWRLDTVNVG